MEKGKKTVFLTGATGNMGMAGLRELLKKKDRFHIRILARPSKVNHKKLAFCMDDPDVTVIWGDLMNYDDVLAGVSGSDYVLHVGGMVSPAADYYPEKTMKTNVTSARYIVRAVLAQPNADEIRVVYIGSVAQYGDRLSPWHWGRAGDPVRASRYDAYSVSKCVSESIIVNSGIRHWVSLRQSGILYPGILKVVNPTAFHVPIQGVLEWATIEDSGRLLANVVEDSVPEDFWNRFYNISSGEEYRMTNYEFEMRLLAALGLPGPEKVFEPQWFATRNFHGMWYTDADVLENYLHFRANVPVDDYFRGMKKKLPWYYSLAFLAPAFAVKMFMKPYAWEENLGTQWWVENDPEKVETYYGSMEEYRAIRSWEQMRPQHREKNIVMAGTAGEIRLPELGWDTSKSVCELSAEEIEAAAAFRGGHFLGKASAVSERGSAAESGKDANGEEDRRRNFRAESNTLYEWECAEGHRFKATLEWVLLGGGWCPECPLDRIYTVPDDRNRFLSQVLRPAPQK